MSARTRLSYPLYGADFDPLNHDFLLVGGGGGSTSSGVPNKLTLLDISRPNEISEVADIDLSRKEDSVQSLAVVQSDESSLLAYAGINSTETGKNEHLRSFTIDLPRRKDVSDISDEKVGQSQSLARTAFFKPGTGPKSDTYQRRLRVSLAPRTGGRHVAAIASGLATDNEVIVFDAVSTPQANSEIGRISLGRSEAEDLDFSPFDDQTQDHTLAYCTEYEVFLYEVSPQRSSTSPTSVHSTPETVGGKKRPKFRALRYISPRHLLLMQNKPDRSGVEVVVLKVSQDRSNAAITLQKTLNPAMKAATSLDVCILSSSSSESYQIFIAVAGQNLSIELLTMEHSMESGTSTFRPYQILKDVHSGPITKVVFSKFLPPPQGTSRSSKPQLVRLASTSAGNTVAVHTFPLRLDPESNNKSPNYVLVPAGSSAVIQNTFSIFMAIVVVGIVALLMQVFTEIRGYSKPTLGASNWLSPGLRDIIARPHSMNDKLSVAVPTLPTSISSVSSAVTSAVRQIPGVDDVKQKLREVVLAQSNLETPKAIVVRDAEDGDLSTELHHVVAADHDEALTKWENLGEEQKDGWRKRLEQTGHWTADNGEGVLLGVFFGELGGAVGAVIAGG